MFLRFTLLLILALSLAACGPVYQTSYSYQPPASIQGKQCIIQCQQAKTTCESACSTRKFQCQQAAMSQARFNFAEYRSQQKLQGKPISQDLNDFYNPIGCDSFCGQCPTNFNNCYTMCGGKVLVHKKCVAFCGKNQ